MARTVDLPDDAWRRVVDEALELGMLEAVLTGGEPLLRAPLALELLERLCSAGIGVTLNTNGWFLDEATADRLAALRGLTVSVSIDGATPELHDRARGVPGSWRRAVAAIDRLLQRDVPVVVGHVVTPANARWVEPFLEHMWLLGVRTIRITPVVPIGAASRERGWAVDRHALRRTVADTCRRLGDDLQAVVQGGTADILAVRETRAPAALLVRPNGAVLIDSLHPFAFGRVEDGLAECWRRIVAEWRDPELERWASGLTGTRGLATASVVPYADDEAEIGQRPVRRRDRVAPRLPRRSARSTDRTDSPGDVPAARAEVVRRGLERHYDVRPHRWSGDGSGERVVRLLELDRVCRLNRTAGIVLDSLGAGRPGEVVEALAAAHPEVSRERLSADVLGSVRWLTTWGALRPAPAG